MDAKVKWMVLPVNCSVLKFYGMPVRVQVAHETHNLTAEGSIPLPATKVHLTYVGYDTESADNGGWNGSPGHTPTPFGGMEPWEYVTFLSRCLANRQIPLQVGISFLSKWKL